MRSIVVAGCIGLVALLVIARPVAGDATSTEIGSSGPLTRIIVSNELNCQVAHRADQALEFFDGVGPIGACGTFLALDGVIYGPSSIPSGLLPTPWTPVSQSAATGSGTEADPFRIVTLVAAGATGVQVEQTDAYVVGRESFRTDIRLANPGLARTAILYRAADCYLQESDVGFGRLDGAAPACVASEAADARLEQWLPLTPGAAGLESDFSTVWSTIAAQQPFPGTCTCRDAVDNGAGISWNVALPGGGAATFSHLTLFSPGGRRPLTARLLADRPSVAPGGRAGYTLTIDNPNPNPVTLDTLYLELPPSFAYLAGSTSGATSADPAVAGSRITWGGPFTVPPGGNVSIRAGVSVASTVGIFAAAGGASSPTDTVTPAEGAGLIDVGGVGGVPFRRSVPDPTQISLDPVIVVQSLALAAGVVALVPFPSALFNSTLEQHYDEIMAPVLRMRAALGPLITPVTALLTGFRRIRVRRSEREPIRPDPLPFFASPSGILTFVALSAVLYGLLDPTFGLEVGSIATFLGIFVGLVVTLLLFAIPYVRTLAPSGIGLIPRALPGTLLVAAACVLVSRFTGFEPGYLYGLIIGWVLSRRIPIETEGRSHALATAVILGGAFAAWLLLVILRAAVPPGTGAVVPGDPIFLAVVLETACATVIVAGLESAIFGLLPLRFLPGEKVFRAHRPVWVLLLGIGTFAFCHVLLNPSTGYLADSTRVSLATSIALLVAFGIGSVAFWAYFRYRGPRPAAR